MNSQSVAQKGEDPLTRADLTAYQRRLNILQIEQMRHQLTDAYKHLHDQIVVFYQNNEREIKKPQFRQQFMSLCVALGIDPLSDTKMVKIKRYFYQLAVKLLGSFVEFEPLDAAARRLHCEVADIERAISVARDFTEIKIIYLEDGVRVLSRCENAAIQHLARLLRGQLASNAPYTSEQLRKHGLTDEEISALLTSGNLAIDTYTPGGLFDPNYWVVM